MMISDQAMYQQPKIFRILVKIWNFIASSFILGDGFRNKLKMLYLYFRWKMVLKFSVSSKILPPVEHLSIVFEGNRLRFQFPDDPSFPHILYEVFVCLDYSMPLSRKPDCILDVGANIGMASLFYSCRFPEARIHAFEPNAKNYRYLELNTHHLKNVVRHPLGLFSHTGKQRLYLNRFCGKHSMVRPNETAYEEIDTITLDDFLAAEKILHVDVLKIDVEGAEEEILTSTHSLSMIDHILGELHVDVMDTSKVLGVLEREFNVVSQPTSPDLAFFVAENKRLSASEAKRL